MENIEFFNEKNISVYFAPFEKTAVKIACDTFIKDLETIFNKNIRVVQSQNAEVIIGSYHQLDELNLLSEVKIKSLFDEKNQLIWESFFIEEKNGQIYIVGADTRGTIFGIYEFSKRIGISPWHFFADVPAKKKESYYIEKNFFYTQYPSVQYRGIFINDEEELNNWAIEHTADGTIGPETYVHIFELLLRLKANYIWPAMHVNYFDENPDNGKLANDMGIIVGTSHCDMLLRSNQNEWEPWLESKGYQNDGIKYDYSIEGKNREILNEYWTEGVQMNSQYDVSFTVGMRGIHDSGFITEQIDNNSKLTVEEKEVQKKLLLEKVINDQRIILKKTLQKNERDILQTFVPYKEVLKYYDAGLKIPEDVTIIWANDNYGYVRRFPSTIDQKRSGGHGLYYHSSYWAPNDMHYLFISSTPLARMKNELQKSWDNGIRKMWVLNVGALKPIEQDLEFFTRFAFEVGKEETTRDIETFLANWIDSNFSNSIGSDTARILNDFCQITNVRKIEQMDTGVFSQTAFGDEFAMRLLKIKQLFEKGNELADRLPIEEKEAFFELVQMKIHAAYYKNAEYYFADRSVLAFKQGKMNAADEYREHSQQNTLYLRWMIYYYNTQMCDGKWNKILTPELAPPPIMKMYPPTKPSLEIKDSKMGVSIWQGSKRRESLVFSKNSPNKKWFEVFNFGNSVINFTINCPDWIKLSCYSGSINSEKRIIIKKIIFEKYELEKNENKIQIIGENGDEIFIPVSVIVDNQYEQISDSCLLESDNYISIDATKYDEIYGCNEHEWKIIKHLGRFCGDALESYSNKLCSIEEWSNLPRVSYNIYLETPGCHLIEFYRLPTLNSVGKIRFGIGVDGKCMQVVETKVTDEKRGNWEQCVLNEVDKLYANLPFLDRGEHKLDIYMIDSYVTLSKMVLYTDGFVNSSLGPHFSGTKNTKNKDENVYLPLQDNQKLIEICEKYYLSKIEEVPLPEILFCGKNYYQQRFLHETLTRKKQNKLGTEQYLANADGTKNIIKKYLTQSIIKEENGIIAFEAEFVLAQNNVANSTTSYPNKKVGEWEHIGAPTNNGTGLGMYINGEEGILWENGLGAPKMNYLLDVNYEGDFYIWIFLKYNKRGKDEVCFSVNNELLPKEDYYSKKGLFSYMNLQIWHWNLLAKAKFKAGKNIFSIVGKTAGVQIDRIYLCRTDTEPPLDQYWKNTSVKEEELENDNDK